MANKNQLVCQHLENISRKVLMDYKDIIREYVRRRHSVQGDVQGDVAPFMTFS